MVFDMSCFFVAILAQDFGSRIYLQVKAMARVTKLAEQWEASQELRRRGHQAKLVRILAVLK